MQMQLPIQRRGAASSTPSQLSVHWPEEGLKLAVKNTFYTVESDDEEDDDARAGSKSCVARMAQGVAPGLFPEADGADCAPSPVSFPSRAGSNTSVSSSSTWTERSLSPLPGVRLAVRNTFWSVESDDEDETWIGTKSCFARMSATPGSWFDEDCSPSDRLSVASTALACAALASVGVTSAGLASSSWEVGADTPAASSPSVAAEFAVPPVSVLPAPPSPPVAEALPQSLEMATGPEPSLGSVGHGTAGADGKPGCEPCAWFWRPGKCVFRGDCKFCHMCPEDEGKRRKKEKVMRLRKLEREERARAGRKQKGVQ